MNQAPSSFYPIGISCTVAFLLMILLLGEDPAAFGIDPELSY